MGGWERINPELRAVCRAAHVDGECSGREGDKLIAAIKALQQSEYVIHGAPVDGPISPATKDAQYKHRGTQQVYIIFWLNHVLRALHPEQYPRIDLMPQFVWRIKEQALAPFLA
jgi:hypothetical protein